MLIPFDVHDKWDELNSQIRRDLKISEQNNLKVHAGIIPALREIVLGLTQLFPHKMTIAYQAKTAHYIDDCIKNFTRLGYKTLPLDDKELPKDTLVVVVANDHPITGAIYDHTLLSQGLNEKKIFIIRLSHKLHLYRPQPLDIKPFDISVFAFDGSPALSIGGERAKMPSYFSPYLSWNESFKPLFNSKKEYQKEILAFEIDLPVGATALFDKQIPRLFDRSIIFWKDIDGLAIAQGLAEELGQKDEPGHLIDTLSMCRWENAQVLRPYIVPDSGDEAFRGAVLIGGELVNDKLKMLIQKVTKNIKEMQDYTE